VYFPARAVCSEWSGDELVSVAREPAPLPHASEVHYHRDWISRPCRHGGDARHCSYIKTPRLNKSDETSGDIAEFRTPSGLTLTAWSASLGCV
jgi:hypothetical protein